jgi:hypothetical protein
LENIKLSNSDESFGMVEIDLNDWSQNKYGNFKLVFESTKIKMMLGILGFECEIDNIAEDMLDDLYTIDEKIIPKEWNKKGYRWAYNYTLLNFETFDASEFPT